MKQIKTNAMRQLDKKKISYQYHEYESDGTAVDGVTVANKIGKNPEMVFKTLVITGANHTLFVFCIPVEKELDLKKAAKIAGQKSVAMLPVAEINQYTGYVRGGCSPIGMKKQYPTFLDTSALTHDTILVSGGKIGLQIEVAPQALRDTVNAMIAECTQ